MSGQYVTKPKLIGKAADWRLVANSFGWAAACGTVTTVLGLYGDKIAERISDLSPGTQLGDVFQTVAFLAGGFTFAFLWEGIQNIRLVRAQRRNARYGEGTCLNPPKPKAG